MRLYEDDKGATRYKIPLDPKKIVKKTIVDVLVFLIFWIMVPIIIGAIWLEFFTVFWVIVLTVVPTILIAPIYYIYQKLYFYRYYYNVEPNILIIRKGVWAPHEIRLPYSKIQNVYVDRDLLDVVFGLYDVHLATADSASNFYAHVDGLKEENAIKLRDILLKKIEKSPKTTDGL